MISWQQKIVRFTNGNQGPGAIAQRLIRSISPVVFVIPDFHFDTIGTDPRIVIGQECPIYNNFTIVFAVELNS